MSQYFEYMGPREFAVMTGRSTRRVQQMVQNGILVETGHKVRAIPSKSGKRKVGQYAIGVPRESSEAEGRDRA